MQDVIAQLNRAQRRILSPLEQVLERPIKRDFAVKVNSLKDLDPAVCLALQDQLKPGEQTLILIKVPSQIVEEGGKDSKWFYFSSRRIVTPEWVLALTGERLLLASTSEPGAILDTLSIPFENLFSFQLGSVLLFSWIEFKSIEEGLIKRTRIYYNTVSSNLFEELSCLLRGSVDEHNGLASASKDSNSLFLTPLSYKFKNLIRLYLLMPDEQIQSLLFRAAMWSGRSFFRREVAANLAIVTSKSYFMLVEENLSNTKANYGMIYSYFPSKLVKDLSVCAEGAGLQLMVSARMQNLTQEIRVVFPPECEKEVEAFAGEYNRRHLQQ
jgi:hypothetical protein